jgi:glyoxylase-like metal-dependent hydrolase (beta-lactamase superfamily II)
MKGTNLLHVAVVVALMTVPAAGQDDRFADVEIKAAHVAGNVHMLEGRGGNIGVSVGADGILIVDDQFAPLADKIRAALGKLGEGKLRFVLNTHYHGDHTGGNPEFGPEAPIISHHNVRERLVDPPERNGRRGEPMVPAGLPVLTYGHDLVIHFNGEPVKVVHFPHGHTDGDSVIFFTKSNVVHMGDDMFAGRFPFVDIDAGGDVEGLTANIEKLLGMLPADVKLIPGHGPISGLDDLKAYHRMLVETTGIVRKRMGAGNSLEQIQEAGLPEEWAEWGTGFISTERWLATIHRSLSD